MTVLRERSLKEGEFTLTSGKKSAYYFDGKQTTLNPRGIHLVGNAYVDKLEREGIEIDAIGGPVIGADPIVTAVAYASYLRGGGIEAFLVRKAQKQHGTRRRIEGHVEAGSRVCLVDDVCTTGGSIQDAVEACLEADLVIAAVMPLLDREEGGAEKFADYRFLPLVRASEIRTV